MASDSSVKKSMEKVEGAINQLIAKDLKLPDYATPVVKALYTLQREFAASLKSIDVKPQVNVEAPNVTVDATKVDLSGVEKLLKTTIPQAFEAAIKQIPTPKPVDFSDILSELEGMSRQLESIDTASRLKPTFPNSMKVTNADGTAVNDTINYTTRIATVGFFTYVGKATPNSSDANNVWQIQRIDETSGTVIKWANGSTSFTNVWNNREALTYS